MLTENINFLLMKEMRDERLEILTGSEQSFQFDGKLEARDVY